MRVWLLAACGFEALKRTILDLPVGGGEVEGRISAYRAALIVSVGAMPIAHAVFGAAHNLAVLAPRDDRPELAVR